MCKFSLRKSQGKLNFAQLQNKICTSPEKMMCNFYYLGLNNVQIA